MMKSGLLLLIATISLCLCSYGQEITKEDILKYGINSITYIDSPGNGKRIEVYNDHGDIIRRTFTSEEGTDETNTEYRYNDSFQLIKSVLFLRGRNQQSSAYFYTNHRLSRMETSTAGNSQNIETYEYDKNGRQTKKVLWGRLGQPYHTTKYVYNDQNLLTSEVTTYHASGKKLKTLYTYNSQGQPVKTVRELMRSVIYTTLQEYNDSGRINSRIDSTSDGDVFAFTYTYGPNGLLTAIHMQGLTTENGKKKPVRSKTTVVIGTGQASRNERMLYIVDSIPVLKDPEAWNPISKEDWADLRVIRDRDSITLLGWVDVDAITYIFTKAYRSRPDSVKRIPLLQQMELINNVWHLHGIPYTGKYIEYYNSGRIMGEGVLAEGKLNGAFISYYPNGQKKFISHYKDGALHGSWKDYYPNGALMQVREYWEGKASQARKEYFINGRLQYEWRVGQLTSYDTAVAYYSTGAIKQTTIFREGQMVYNKKTEDLRNYTGDFYRALKDGDLKEANKAYYKIWKLDSASADTYFKGGMLMLKEFRFDEALAEFSKALEVEPLMMDAFACRVLARLKKYKYASLKPLPKDFREPDLTGEDFTALPYDEQLRACDDLQHARSLGFGQLYANKILPGEVLDQCEKKTSF
jgi:antitoxin component YwqK of YwqJK toxin-antitoxin module